MPDPLATSAPPPPVARAGDLVIVQERYDNVISLVLSESGILHNRFGRFRHSDVIGLPLGRRWDAMDSNATGTHVRGGRGFVYVLAPSSALWSMAMLHRTQVVYPHDSAIISLHLELRPGCILVESGTGAGSASVAFGRAVAPHGRVHSFEFHAGRAAAAAADFRALGLGDVVRVTAGHDVVAHGFAGVADGAADAVFLDLPAPHLVLREAARVLRADGALCAFSPCVEQVQRTCGALGVLPFHSVFTVTAPTRTFETRVDPRGGDAAEEAAGGVGKKRKRGGSVAKERSEAFRKAEEDGGVAGRVLRPKVPLRSRAFAHMKGHTSYLTFARRERGELPPHVEDVGTTGSSCIVG